MPKCSRVEDSGAGQAKNNKMGTAPASSKNTKIQRPEERKDKQAETSWMDAAEDEDADEDEMAVAGWSCSQPLQTWDVQVLAKK